MPHTNNKKPRRGNHNHNSPARGVRQSSDVNSRVFNGALPLNSARAGPGTRAFTLQDEARNTERHHSWDSDQRLRDTKVSFVSAGSLDPTISLEPEMNESTTSLAQMVLDPSADKIIAEGERVRREIVVEEELVVEVYEEPYNAEDLPKENVQRMAGQPFQRQEQQDLFFIDTQGNKLVETGMPPPRVSSPTPSNSSDEVILFAGRDKYGRGLSKPTQVPRTISDPIDARIKQVEKQIHKQEELLEDILHHKSQPVFTKTPDTSEESSAGFEVSILQKTSGLTAARGRRSNKQIEEDALFADYLANMDSEHEILESFGRRELGGTEDELWQETELSSGEPKATCDREDIDDFDDMSTSDGVMGDVETILSKRKRPAGMQYLVVWEDQSMDDARWVPVTTLTSINALREIQKFEVELKLEAEFMESGEDDSEETDDDDDVGLDGEPVPQKQSKLSDRQIARLLAKQEELGIGGDELLLFDGEGDDEQDVHFYPAVSMISKRSPRGEGQATAVRPMSDPYDGFDIMDLERPSLKRKPKGRKGKIEFDLSDSDLRESMLNAFENDRVKKKKRKQEREELRAQGLLSSKKPDMKQKYKEGMVMNEIKEEIKNFLNGNNTTLALPPMEKEERKIVHGIANAFKLKSKSDGSGKKRFPILYKTARTRPYFAGTFDLVAAKTSRGFLPRPDVKHLGRSKATKGLGGFNNASVSYRDGDVVGASAPELGVENRGRAMLEKMGWSTGTALGALNNKGILQPVTHVVKTSKAGLG